MRTTFIWRPVDVPNVVCSADRQIRASLTTTWSANGTCCERWYSISDITTETRYFQSFCIGGRVSCRFSDFSEISISQFIEFVRYPLN
uniref:Uncharacterized protein n=1 Tax=Arundo donax TaxID=35708 RepID=A0A0A8ZMS2_ARUDO